MPLACEEEIHLLCLELTPPHLLSTIDSWWYPQGDSKELRDEAAHRVKVIDEWTNERIPSLLQCLHEKLYESTSLEVRLKASVVAAASLFLTPRRGKGSSIGREAWITAQNTNLAESILKHPFLQSSNEKAKGQFGSTVGLDVVYYILEHYLKPLFSSTPLSSIDANTGRAAPAIPNLSGSAVAHSGGNLMDDEILWKGGDIDKSKTMSVLGQKVCFTLDAVDSVLQIRHRALGCYNVLFFCCQSLQAAQEVDSGTWERAWPLVLPPLLSLLEDTTPLYRLVGSQILALTVLQKADKKPSLIGTLLLRTGVESLLRERLESNLSFITTPLSAALLQSSAETVLLLTQAVTSEMRPNYPSPLNAIPDGGKARYNQLSKIVDDGVLRVWAYASSSAPNEEDLHFKVDGDKTEMEESEAEADDVINASIVILVRLSRDDALGIGIARYLDVTLEFLTAQLNGLEARLGRYDVKEQRRISLKREICSARAIESLLSTCCKTPGIKLWSARCLTSASRVFVLLHTQKDRKQVQNLFSHLNGIIKALHLAEPVLTKSLSKRLLNLDDELFRSFLDAD